MSYKKCKRLWAPFLLGILSPLQFLRIYGVNFTLFDLACLICLLFYILVRGKYPTISTGYLVASFSMSFAVVMSSIGSINVTGALGQASQWMFIFFVVIPILFKICKNFKSKITLLLGILVGVSIVITMSVDLWVQGKVTGPAGRFGGPYKNPQMLGFQVACTLPISIFVAMYYRENIQKAASRWLVSGFAYVVLFGSLSLLYISGSRSSASAAAISLSLFLILAKTKSISHTKIILTFLANVITLCLLLWISSLVVDVTVLIDRFKTLSIYTGETVKRIRSITSAIDNISIYHMFFGTGLDNSQYYTEFYVNPHNTLVLLFIESGLVAAITFAFIIIHFYSRTVSRISYLPFNVTSYNITVACVSSFTAFVIISMFNTQSIARIYWVFYSVGLASSLDTNV